MKDFLHIVNGDSAGDSLSHSGIPGEILICRDLLYDGVRDPGWPSDASLHSRSHYLSQLTGGEKSNRCIFEDLKRHYRKLSTASTYQTIVLWLDACLCDQAMLAHILVCLKHLGHQNVRLICIDSFPGIEPFNGLGQLKPAEFATLFPHQHQITNKHFSYAQKVETAFATQDMALFSILSQEVEAPPLPFIPAAVKRWLQENPDPKTGLGRLEHLCIKAISEGCNSPGEIFQSVARDDHTPQFWGDTILWQKINGLADRDPPLVSINGPLARLPQWKSPFKLSRFRISIAPGATTGGTPD